MVVIELPQECPRSLHKEYLLLLPAICRFHNHPDHNFPLLKSITIKIYSLVAVLRGHWFQNRQQKSRLHSDLVITTMVIVILNYWFDHHGDHSWNVHHCDDGEISIDNWPINVLIPCECHVIDPDNLNVNPVHVFLHKLWKQLSCSEAAKERAVLDKLWIVCWTLITKAHNTRTRHLCWC